MAYFLKAIRVVVQAAETLWKKTRYGKSGLYFLFFLPVSFLFFFLNQIAALSLKK